VSHIPRLELFALQMYKFFSFAYIYNGDNVLVLNADRLDVCSSDCFPPDVPVCFSFLLGFEYVS